MVDDLERRSRKNYANLAKNSENHTVMAGRYAEDSDKEEFVWQDILNKLECGILSCEDTILDVGCGGGVLTGKWIRHVETARAHLYLNDIPEMIERIELDYGESVRRPHIHLVPGIFPGEVFAKLSSDPGQFRLILIYGVIHCTSNPLAMIEHAASMLLPGGKMLVGDIPNVNKKGRFLASSFGRAFDAAYKKLPIENAPIYADQHDFVSQYRDSLPSINDQLCFHVLSKYRYMGWNAFVLPQPRSLPYSYTREDILISRP